MTQLLKLIPMSIPVLEKTLDIAMSFDCDSCNLRIAINHYILKNNGCMRRLEASEVH
jgi:hypothetical protein